MTSTNDGKDVKSNQTSGPKGKTYYIELYKSLEARLSGECAGPERARHVCEAWRRVHCLCLHSAPSTHPHLLSWLQRHTSHTILQTEWQSPKSKEQHTWLEDAINAFIEECQEAVSKRDGVTQSWESQLLHRARWFLTVLPNPWGHPVLKALLDSRGPQPSDKEVLEWLKEERGVMFVTRLRQLAASKCDDLALLLAAAVMDRARRGAGLVADADQAEEQSQDKPEALTNEPTFQNILRKEAGFTIEVWELLTDIEFVLLYKGESRARCIDLAKQTPLRNGYKLVERLHNRLENSPQEKKLWKNAKDVATLIAQVVIARCMVVPNCTGVARAALYGCVYSLVQLLPAEKLPTAAAALAAPAATSRHLHTLAAAVHAQCKEERKPFVCSLYVRAITAGMNELEKLKLETEKASEARGIEQTLASWFIQLGTLLSASSRLSCECILTAFSVHPSPAMYERVKRAPPLAPLIMPDVLEKDTETNSEYGSWATDSRTQTNLVKTSETLNLKQTQKQANVLSTAIFAEGEGLGLEADLCQDLAVLLSGPRVKTLYWDLDREVLLENCRTYMERTHGGTRALTTELKYLNLDPNCFQHLPEEEDEDENDIYYGIEKGYEHLVEFEEPEPEDIILDEMMSDYSESTDTASCNSEPLMIISKRKKKKNKHPQIYSEEEVDPLSLVPEILSDKKEIPHSKERSKHKNKERNKSKVKIDHTKDHNENNGISDEITKEIQQKAKKKEQKERKKKEKLDMCNIKIKESEIFQSSRNLSKFVGMKIARSNISEIERGIINSNGNNNMCITDSDYDSQGKSSINSEYDENALNAAFTDALCSMNASENTLPDYSQRTSFPPFSYSPNTVSSVKEEVKKGIQRLIDFRRHKVFNDNSLSRDSPENQSPNYTIDHDLVKSKKIIHSPIYNPKDENFLNTPHVQLNNIRLNNIPIKQHTVVKNESSKICMATNTDGNIASETKTSNSSFQTTKDRQHLLVSEKLTKQRQLKSWKPKQPPQVRKQTVNKLYESPSQKQYQEFLLQRKYDDTHKPIHAADSIGQLQFQEFLKKQYLQPTELSVPPSRDLMTPPSSQQIDAKVTPSQKQFHSFLKELQETINAGTINEVKDSKSLLTHDKTAARKNIQNKKVDNAANTYARLSYMHKNKQSESKLKPANNPIIQNKSLVNVTPDQIRHLKDIDVEKVSHLQASGEIVLSKIDKPKSKTCAVDKAKVLVQNIENISTSALKNPVLSNMLSSDKKMIDYTELGKNEIKVIKPCNSNTPKPTSSFLSEKDQLDLLALLRQQNKLNLPKMSVKTEYLNNPSSVLINNSATHCVNSEKQCLDLQNKIPILVEEAKTISCPTSVIKVANNRSLNNGSEQKKNRVKSSKQKVKNESDWKSVMDDILAHKTPTMIGPNALDVVLKKDSFEKRSSETLNSPNNKTVITSCKNSNSVTNNDIVNHCSQNTHVKASTSRDNLFFSKPTHLADLKLKQNIVQSANKIGTVEVAKKGAMHIENKHFSSVIQNSNDPFISGIPNSDYDLLEELMDDDLRQEIGELSSDEDTYRTSNLSASKMKINLHAKECGLPINKANVVAAENRFNYNPISSSDLVKKSYNTNHSIVTKGLSIKNNSLPKSIIHKKSDSTKDANSKPQIISNELITSSTFAEKSLLSGKVCKNVSGKILEAVAPNDKLCLNKVSNAKKTTITTASKTKNQHSNKTSVNICSDHNPPKTLDNTKVLMNNVPKSQNPAQVLLTVPQRNTQAQNVVLIGKTDLIYNPFTIQSTIQLNQSTDLNRNTFVAVNQAPVNVALLHSTPFVAPVLSPMIIESSVTLPVIQNVAPNIPMNLISLNSKKPENSSVCKDYQHLNKIKTEPIQSNPSNEVHEKICQSNKEDFEKSKFKATASRSTAVDSDMSTLTPTVLSNTITEDLVRNNLLISDKSDVIPEDTESQYKKPSAQNHPEKVPHFDTKSDSQVQKDRKSPLYESTEINTLIGKTLPIDNKTDVQIDQERIKRKRLLILSRLENFKNNGHEKPIALPYAPIKSSEQNDKKVESKFSNEEKNKRYVKTKRKTSDKTDSCQKQSLPFAKVNRANRSSARLTALRDVPNTIQESKQNNKDHEVIQNSVEKKCLTRDRNVRDIPKNLSNTNSNNSDENNTTLKSKSGYYKGNTEFIKPNNEINHSYNEKPVCKENIEKKIGSANNFKLISDDHLIMNASKNNIKLKSVEIQTVNVVKKSCQKIDDNISKENNRFESSTCESICNENEKEVPIDVSKVNNKWTPQKLAVHKNKDDSRKITPQNEINSCEEVKKARIFSTKNIVDDSVHMNWFDIEEQIKPVMIKSSIKKSDEFCKDNISLGGDNDATHDLKASPLISPVMIISTTKKADEFCKDNISLVVENNMTHDQKASPLISPVMIKNSTKKCDELCKDISLVGENNTTHAQKATRLISPVMTKSATKTLDKLCKDNICLVDDKNMKHDQKVSPLINPVIIKSTTKISDEFCKDNISLVDDNNTTRDQNASPLKIPVMTKSETKKLDKSCKDNISLVGENNTTHAQKATPLISPVMTKSATKILDKLCKDNICLVDDNNMTHDQKASPLINPVMIKSTTKISDEFCKDNISLVDDNNTTRDQKATLLISPIMMKSTIKKSDELCEENISLVDDNTTTHVLKDSRLISQIKANELGKATNISFLGNNVRPQENKVSCPISQSISVKDTSNDLNKKSTVQQKSTVASNVTRIVQEILGTDKLDVNSDTKRNTGIQRERTNNGKSTIKSVDNTQPKISQHRKGFNDIRKNKGSLNLENEPSKSKNCDLLDAKITYEDFPNACNGPQKRCVRIKLSNGNTFKATISGKMNVNIDSIFEDPTVKHLLWKNINNNTKCTLNIKQVSIQNKNEPILKTEVKNISYPKPNEAKAETINLISDDEEDASPQSFKTEFGNFNVTAMNTSIHLKHQKRLSQKSVVLLERCTALQEHVPIVQSNVKPNEPDKCSIPSEKPVFTPQETVTDYIEIDDSSNDSISLISSVTNTNSKTTICNEKVHELKNLLLKDFGVEVTSDKIQKDTLNTTKGIMKNVGEINNTNVIQIEMPSVINEMKKGIQVNNSSVIETETLNLINEIHKTIEEVNKSTDMKTEMLNVTNEINKTIGEDNITEKEDIPVRHIGNNSKQFLLKLKKCDDLVEKLRIKRQKCFVSLIRCDDASQNVENNLRTYEKGNEESLDDVLSLGDEIGTTKLKPRDSESILSDLDKTTGDLSSSTYNEEPYAPMSPSLIDNFEIPLSLIENVIESSDNLVGLSNIVCDADWCMTKSILNKLNNFDRVSLERFKECERDEDSLTDCDSDYDTSLSMGESFQVPSLLKLAVNLLASDSNVLVRYLNQNLTSKNVQNMNPSPLKRKSNEMVEIRQQNKISKIENNLDSEHVCQSKQNIECNNTVMYISENIKISHSASTKEKPIDIYKESKHQQSEGKGDIQNDMQFQQVSSLLQIAIKSFQVNSKIKKSEIEDIANKSKLLIQTPSALNEDVCFGIVSGNSSRIAMDLKVNNLHNEINLGSHKSVSEGVGSVKLKRTCSLGVSDDSSHTNYSGMKEIKSYRESTTKNIDICTNKRNNDFVHLDTLEDEIMHNTCAMDDKSNTESSLVITDTHSLSQLKIDLETDSPTVKMFEDYLMTISEVKETDIESSSQIKETEKEHDFVDNIEWQRNEEKELPKNEQRIDDVKETKECNTRDFDNSAYSISTQFKKLTETRPSLQSESDVYCLNTTLRGLDYSLDIDSKTSEDEAMIKAVKENTERSITLGEPNVTTGITVECDMSETKPALKLETNHALKLNEKEKACADYDNAKPCSSLTLMENSHLDLLSSNDFTSDLEAHAALKQTEHGVTVVFNSSIKQDKVNDSNGKSSSEIITSDDDDTHLKQQIKFDAGVNDNVYLKHKIDSENQENTKLDLSIIDNPNQTPNQAPNQAIKLCNSNNSFEKDLFEDKSFIEVEVKQSEINAADQLHVNLESSTNLAQHPYSHDNDVPYKNLKSTQTLDTLAEPNLKLAFKIEDKNLLTGKVLTLKVSEGSLVNNSEISKKGTNMNETNTSQLEIDSETLKMTENNVVDIAISDTYTYIGKENEKESSNTSEDMCMNNCKMKKEEKFDSNKLHVPIILPHSKLDIDGEIIKEDKISEVFIGTHNAKYSETVSLKTDTELIGNKLDIDANVVNCEIMKQDKNFDVVIDTCNDINLETINPEDNCELKEVENNVFSCATMNDGIRHSTTDKNNFETDSIFTEPMSSVQPIINSHEHFKQMVQIDGQSNRDVIFPMEEIKDRIDIIGKKENNLEIEVDRTSLERHTKYELTVEVHEDNLSTSCDLNPLITMQNTIINSPLNQNFNKCDHSEDELKSCFPKKSECISSAKATNEYSKLEENFNSNVKSNDPEIHRNRTNRDLITYHSNEFTALDMNNINENTDTDNEAARTNNPVSLNEKINDNNVRCSDSEDSVFHRNQGINQSPDNVYVNDETNLTNELSRESETADKVESSSINNNKLQKNVTLVYKGHSNVILKGSIYEDPVVGTCYVFPVINRTSVSDETNRSNVCDNKTINVIESLKSKVFEDCNKHDVLEEVQTVDNFNLILPKLTYSRQRLKNNDSINSTDDKTNRKNLKRRLSCYDNKFHAKRYRKGKNIDYPKFSVATVLESAYSKEYKRLLDYWSSIKFSYSRPFHKEDIDVPGMLNGWPIKENTNMNVPDDTDFENILFLEEQFEKAPFDPLQQTLAEEISLCKEQQYISCDINETNFNMGFGEGSDRVIQISEDGNNISKVSAATLSDVKQSQPFLTSEHYKYCSKNQMLRMSHKHQIEILKRSISCIQLRDKVRSFFKKTTAELNYHWLMDTMKSKYKSSYHNSIFFKSGFPYDLLNSDFIEPAPVEAIVQVVQVGQLPVSAAAQNPVTCDPRVTQVTDASPQCSIENSPHDDSQSPIKTEYTELTTADLSLPLVQEYDRHMESQESSKMPNSHHEDIPVETEITSIVKTEITVELSPLKEEPIDYNDSDDLQSLVNKHINNVDYSFDSNDNSMLEPQSNTDVSYESLENHETEFSPQEKQQNGSAEKTDQIAHAMNAAGITTTPETMMNTRAHTLVNMLSQKNCQEGPVASSAPSANNYSKTPVNAMMLQQALAQILPPPLNQTNIHENNQTNTNSSVTSQVLHIVQGKNTNGNQITLVDNSQNSVINNSNTPVLHIVQNKGASTNSTPNANSGQHTNSYSGLSLVDAGIQQGSNQFLHIVNTGNQKNNSTGQLLKRVNLLTNLTNVQGSNEQKMVQFVCKSADGKSIHLNAPHQRSMVLRLQPIESPNIQPNPKTAECQDNTSSSPTSNINTNTTINKESTNAQHEIKSRSVYEENYAKFIQNSSNKSVEKSTSLPKFGQAFGKQVFQDGNQKGNDINANNSNLSSINSNTESSECQPNENSVNLDHIGQINSPPLLLRKSPSQPAHSQPSQANLVQQIKQTIAPMNIQTMHGGVIYTRQIPVNIGGGQTINLITVPSTELIDEGNQKQKGDVKFVNQNEIDSPIIKIVPQNQSTPNAEGAHDDANNHTGIPNENAQNTPSQHQPVLTQMRIKLPMLSKTPQMVSGARVVRPSFFQIQRNVIGGANQHVYQQLVLTAAPPLGQHTIRLPQAQANRQVTKTTTDGQSASEPQMSSSTLEQLREFDMVLEQVKERSTVQPNSNNTFTKLLTPTTEANEGTSVTSTVTESTQQVLYSIGSNQSLNVAYINRKTVATTPTTTTFVRSPDSSGIIDSPSSSSHVQIPHTVTSESTLNEASAQPSQPKPAKVGSKSKSRPKSSSNPPSSLKINTLPPKPTQKPLEDEQTTQRILYILAEYKEQVENSPDKDKPAPRRRSNPPTNPSGSSKRKKSSSGSRRPGARDMSPVHGEDTCRTMGSEDSSCGTSQGDCADSCLDSHSPQDSPRKVARKLTFENETSPVTQPRPQPQRNVIVADGQTITVARGTAGKPATAVLMPANYILPVSMVKGGQQIAIVTNRGPKLLTVGGGEGGATNALLLQRLIGPAGLKPVLTRPGVRHVRLPTAALHNLQAFNLTTATTVQPPDSTASPAPAPTPPELIETRANSSPWTDRESQDVKPERESSPEGSEPWNLPSSADPHDYTYEETVRTDNMNRTVLEAIPDRYSPDMEAQRIFDKMFDVESKKSYIDSHDDSSRCAYDIDASDCDDKVYHQVVHKKDGTSQRHHRLTHVSAAALRHKYAILEHELRLQKSLSEECEDLGVDSPSASELFPEAELLFAASPAHDAPHHDHTTQPTILNQSGIPQPDIDDQIATDELLQPEVHEDQQELDVSTLGLDEGIVTVSEDGMQATIQLDQEEFARSHPNTTFHSEPTDEGEVQPFTISGLKGRHITSTIFHAGRAPATVLVTAPQTTVISQANPDHAMQNNVKYANMNQIINSSPVTHGNLNLSSVLVKDDGLTKFDNILTDSRELHLSNTASAIVHSTGNATQVIRRVCYEDDKRDTRFLMDEPDAIIAGDDAKMIAEDSSRDATLESIAGDVDDDNSSPERHAELFWESNSASERSESRRPMDFSSDSEKCCKSPSFDETISTDSSGVGTHMRLDSVIKDARGIERSGSADGSSADDAHPPLRTYPAKRMYHALDGEVERSMSGKTRAGERSPDSLEVRRRASGRGVVKRGCHCCTGSPAPPRPKKSRQRKPAMDFTN